MSRVQVLGADTSVLFTDAKDFTSELLLVDVQRRLTARAALQHPWLQSKGQLCRLGHYSTGE